MKFVDEGYIIGVRRHGENSAIVTVLCREQGKVTGFVKSAFSRKNLAVFQVGNLIKVDAWSRVDDNMLALRVELIKPYSVDFISSATKLTVLNSFASLCNICLPELQPLERLYYFISSFIQLINEENWLTHYCFFEFYLLEFLGIGIDLTKCAATGVTTDLAFVSPKSACAISYSSGLPYSDKLFKFPDFIKNNDYNPNFNEIKNLLQMTGFFLNKNFFTIHNLKFPISRANLSENFNTGKI